MEKLIKIFQLLFGGYLDLEDIGTQIKVSKMSWWGKFFETKVFHFKFVNLKFMNDNLTLLLFSF